MAVITRSSDPKPPRVPTPFPNPTNANRGRGSRRGGPRAQPAPASSRTRGYILSPLAEGRARGVRAGPVPRPSTTRVAAGSQSIPVAFATGPGGPPVSFVFFGDSASAPRAASEGPFAPDPPSAGPSGSTSRPASSTGTAVPSQDPGDAPTVGRAPSPLPAAAPDATPRDVVATPPGASGSEPSNGPPEASAAMPAETLAHDREAPPADSLRDGLSARAAGKARAVSLPPSAASLGRDEAIRGRTPDCLPQQDAGSAYPDDDSRTEDGDAAANEEIMTAGASSRASSADISEWGPGGEPVTPPRRNAPAAPPITIFTTDAAALLDEVQRLLPAHPAPAAGPTLAFTPKPADGFPGVYDAIPAAHLQNLARQQAIDWENYPGPKVLVRFGMHGALDETIHGHLRLADRATEEIRAFLGSSTANVALPHPKAQPTKVNEAPYSALVRGLSADDAARLTDQQILATPRITLFFSPFGWSMPALLGVFTGFRATSEEEVYGAVRDHLETLIPMIMHLAHENPVIAAAVSLQGYVDDIIKSIFVRFLPMLTDGGHPDDHYYVYASLPFTTFTSFQAVQTQLAATTWNHSFAGKGKFRVLNDPFCSLCHGADHPRGLCPFPAIPGWITARDPPPPPRPRDAPRGSYGQKCRVEDQGRGGDRRKAPRNY
ncbi:hypothetical protein EIP86_010208 [Pleurotus ostreatoroseus]|nr:hypothetical protein EIP86_010208 [Pleurotus ostreatoroseus]